MEYWEQRTDLYEEIFHLISLRQEGGYWDFKKQWHENKTDLLHDIICMANNLYNRDAYIIIGIDEEHDYAVVDVKDDPNRKNTQKIVDFLKNKKFAGSVRPLVHVDQLRFDSGDIDVIVIDNSHNTPFYLAEPFEGVRANNIYTRVMDTNTPKDGSADINNIEHLWKKRFYLDETPIDKFDHYLRKSSDWEQIPNCDGGYFYKYAPEYTLVSEQDDRNGYEYYLFGQVNKTPSWWLITLRYHQTAIGQFLGLSLDGGRSFVVAPERAFDLYETGISCVGFFTNGLRLHLLEFYHEKETVDEYSYKHYMDVVIVFNSTYEHKQFMQYVKSNLRRHEEIYAQIKESEHLSWPNLEGYNMEHFKKEYRDALVMNRMLDEFRNEVQNNGGNTNAHA